jgi:hypothetical protein
LEVTVSKRKLNITLLVFLVINILPLTYFLIKGLLLDWNIYSIDQHNDLAKMSLLEEEENGVVIKYNGFLKSITDLDYDGLVKEVSKFFG